MKFELTAEIARELLRYEPETGKLFWRKRGAHHFACNRDWFWKIWNTRWADTEAFATDHDKGYNVGILNKVHYRSHRVIWLMVTGDWPVADIDHINGDRKDNRWDNLRSVSRTENCCNSSIRSDNVSGVVGVSWSKSGKKWDAYISKDKKLHKLGLYSTKEEAVAVRKRAEKELEFHPNHGKATT